MTQKECPYDVFTPGLCCDGAATPSGCSGWDIFAFLPFSLPFPSLPAKDLKNIEKLFSGRKSKPNTLS